MERLFDHQNQRMTRCFRPALIVALLVLLLPMAVEAHKCGPSELTVEKGNITVYTIPGHDFVPRYEIVDKGDPLVAMIEPPVDPDNVDLVFKITGMGDGTTAFKLYWQGPAQNDTCSVKVTVSG
jgi:hypothetical protein